MKGASNIDPADTFPWRNAGHKTAMESLWSQIKKKKFLGIQVSRGEGLLLYVGNMNVKVEYAQ